MSGRGRGFPFVLGWGPWGCVGVAVFGFCLCSRGLSGVDFSLALITIVGEGRYKENAQRKMLTQVLICM